MNQPRICILNPNSIEAEALVELCAKYGDVERFSTVEEASDGGRLSGFGIAVIDLDLAGAPVLKGALDKRTGIILTGRDERALQAGSGDWSPEYYVDTFRSPLPFAGEDRFRGILERALSHVRLKAEVEALQNSLSLNESKVREVYSEIKEIKGLINENFIKELERRVSIEAKYIWFRKERQRVEKILRKIYAANDVSSLLDIITDIKEIVQAGGTTIYIMDKNESLGRYLKPLVWDDAFLTHTESSKYIALLDSQDFAAAVARFGQDINITDLSFDRRMSRRYAEHLKTPLKSLMAVPIMHDNVVIGVVEVYNKMAAGGPGRDGFTRQDQEILRGLSEHIAIAMAKLNLIQYDALTGLLRPDPFFEKVLQKVNSRSKRRTEEGAYALAMGDVDWFKNYNDRNGHEAGNKLLRELAGILKLSIREEDLLCRYGGEEFLFLLTGVESLEEACLLTDRIRKNVDDHYFEAQEFQPRNNLTMSFGVAFFPREQRESLSPVTKADLKLLANEADLAMAEAKGKKAPEMGPGDTDERILTKNKVCCFTRESLEERQGGSIRTYRETSYREKRKYERYPASTTLMLRDNGGFKVTKTVNLSAGGAKILSDARLPTSRTIELVLVLGNKAGILKSDIIYSEKANKESPYYYSGLKFKDLGPSEHKILQDYFLAYVKKETAN
ncbi:MAG: diguanylate cyclase [Candidatus Aminicenantales bacterium]